MDNDSIFSNPQLLEIVYFQSLEKDNVINPEALQKIAQDKRLALQNRIPMPGRTDPHEVDTKPFQEYGGFGEENIPERYKYFIGRLQSGLKEAAEKPNGFDSVIYPMCGVDIAAVLGLIKDEGELITIDSEEIFRIGSRIKSEDRETMDNYEIAEAVFQQATKGMNSVEIPRNAWGLAGILKLTHFNPENGDNFTIEDFKAETKEDIIPEHRSKSVITIQIGGKTIKWTHYRMYLDLAIFKEDSTKLPSELKEHISRLQNIGGSLLLSKADITNTRKSITTFTSADLLRANSQNSNFICLDSDEGQPKITNLLDNLTDKKDLSSLKELDPAIPREEVDKHKMLDRTISFGYQHYPSQIILGEIKQSI